MTAMSSKICVAYKPGSTRMVPGRKGMSWEKEERIDEDATAHRGRDAHEVLVHDESLPVASNHPVSA
jgi:hypothetical protein